MHKTEYDRNLIHPGVKLETGGTDDINNILLDLNNICRDIQLSMISTTDGLTMSACGTVLDPDQVGAMCSELTAVCNKAARQLEQGNLQQMFLRCSEGTLLLMAAGEFAILAIMCQPDVNLGLLLIEAQRAATLIQAAL